MENLVAENLFATTSGIAGRTIAQMRWSVSPMIETYIVHDSDGDDHHYNNASFHHIFFKTSLAKIRANVQKSLKGGSVKAVFFKKKKTWN